MRLVSGARDLGAEQLALGDLAQEYIDALAHAWVDQVRVGAGLEIAVAVEKRRGHLPGASLVKAEALERGGDRRRRVAHRFDPLAAGVGGETIGVHQVLPLDGAGLGVDGRDVLAALGDLRVFRFRCRVGFFGGGAALGAKGGDLFVDLLDVLGQ